MNSKINFFDTNALINGLYFIEKGSFFFTCSKVLSELENIKINSTKDEGVKYQARQLARYLRDHPGQYESITVTSKHYALLSQLELEHNNDNLIMACAKILMDEGKDVVFVTGDINCLNIAQKVFRLQTESIPDHPIEVNYTGYLEMDLNLENEEDSALLSRIYMETNMQDDFEFPSEAYETLKKRNIELYANQYLILKNEKTKETIDILRWNGKLFRPCSNKNLNTNMLGKFKALDEYQMCAIDSLNNNQMTMVKGRAGSGKSLLALTYSIQMIEKGKFDRLIIFCNPVAAAGSAKLGYYPGSRDEKLLDSNVGSMLASKFGDKLAVQMMINHNKLMLLPFADVRGFDTTGMRAIIWVLEAQNLDIELMRLGIQRIGEDCKLILDGDYSAQVDAKIYEGSNNGMRRVSEVFRGQEFYGEVELKNIYRSKLALIADKM